MNYPKPGDVVVPIWSDPPKAPDQLPGTKRYVALLRGELVAETDDRDEGFLIVTTGRADTLCDREMKRRVNVYRKANASDYKWPDGSEYPGDVNATVRVVVDERKPGGHRYCFTNFREFVTLAGFREYVVTDERLAQIDLDHPLTEIVVERKISEWCAPYVDSVTRRQRTWRERWIHHNTLKAPVGVTKELLDQPFSVTDARTQRVADVLVAKRVEQVRAAMTPPGGVPVKNERGEIIGRTGELRADAAGNVVADLFIDTDKMPEPPVRSVSMEPVVLDPNDPLSLTNPTVTTERLPDDENTRALSAMMEGRPGPPIPDGNKYIKPREPLIPDGPAKCLHLLVKDAQWGNDRRAELIARVKSLADAIESGALVLDPFVLSLIRAGVVHRMKEFVA